MVDESLAYEALELIEEGVQYAEIMEEYGSETEAILDYLEKEGEIRTDGIDIEIVTEEGDREGILEGEAERLLEGFMYENLQCPKNWLLPIGLRVENEYDEVEGEPSWLHRCDGDGNEVSQQEVESEEKKGLNYSIEKGSALELGEGAGLSTEAASILDWAPLQNRMIWLLPGGLEKLGTEPDIDRIPRDPVWCRQEPTESDEWYP